ncbi:hypothetical protein F4777DRAFT_554482 [Nemania sp. FL0916]|nr:hypothetical protein F4777DRAFT_554482 [Nemania sp. FL0916]
MEQPPDQMQSELESFRQQWREEVSSRARNPEPGTRTLPLAATVSARERELQLPQARPRPANRGGPSSTVNRPPRRPGHEPPAHTKGPTAIGRVGRVDQLDGDDDYVPAPVFEGDGTVATTRARGGHLVDSEGSEAPKEPETALDFYEHAVERESTGKLGDSLQLYRKAFRMDDKVDRKYRDKHFAGRWAKPTQQQQQVNPSGAPVTVPNTAHHSLEGGGTGGSSGAGDVAIPLSFADLIASFAGLKVEGSPPECEGMEPPPCPLAALPDEILVHILGDVATADVGDFVRLAQVCKRLAYLVATENQIWRRVCLGAEFGFRRMHRHFQQSITWEPLSLSDALTDPDSELDDTEAAADVHTMEDLHLRREAEAHATTLALYRGPSGYASWEDMFRRRPRVRFNGCYISTVNYIRPGQNSGQHLTWNTPVHIVTYYRYLRLFRDGTVISLTTTDEPAHVVHHLTHGNLPSQRSGTSHQHQHQYLSSHVMAAALKGRWRLSSLHDQNGDESNPVNNSSSYPSPPQPAKSASTTIATATTASSLADSEGDLYIETEGVGTKYTYRLDLSLSSAGRSAARNNKLVWRGFWSYNKLTDDWAQFTLKNDKPFFFSRVRSYGVGE